MKTYQKKHRKESGVREAYIFDWDGITNLLNQLGYPHTKEYIYQIENLLNSPLNKILIHETNGVVDGFISMHIVPEFISGDTALITNLIVDKEKRGIGIGKLLENACLEIAKNMRCSRIQLHSSSHRIEAHKFYDHLGYKESPTYFSKKIK